MCFQDAFLPKLVFTPHFLKIAVEHKSSELPHLKTVVAVKGGHAPCKILSLQRNLLLCQLNFLKSIDSKY